MTEVLFDGENEQLRKLSGDHDESYSLRVGAAYIEFSSLQPLDKTILIGPYASVRRDEISVGLEVMLEDLY